MATIKTSALISDIRGKIGGNCFARNKAGLYVRASATTAAWKALTAQQRADWQAYALNTSWTNRLGDSINIGGEAAFVRCGCTRLLAALALPTDAPSDYGHASGTISTITALALAQTIVLAEPSTGWSKDLDADQLLLFESMPQSVGREMMPSRWSYMQTVVGSSTLPETFPLTLNTSRWTYVENQRLGLGMVHLDPENRISVRTFAFCFAAV